MSRPPSVTQAHRTVEAAIEGEAIGAKAAEQITAVCSDPDLLMRACLRAMALDGFTAPAGPALRAACRAIQKRMEAQHAPA